MEILPKNNLSRIYHSEMKGNGNIFIVLDVSSQFDFPKDQIRIININYKLVKCNFNDRRILPHKFYQSIKKFEVSKNKLLFEIKLNSCRDLQGLFINLKFIEVFLATGKKIKFNISEEINLRDLITDFLKNPKNNEESKKQITNCNNYSKPYFQDSYNALCKEKFNESLQLFQSHMDSLPLTKEKSSVSTSKVQSLGRSCLFRLILVAKQLNDMTDNKVDPEVIDFIYLHFAQHKDLGRFLNWWPTT